jgi:hypothetical protein
VLDQEFEPAMFVTVSLTVWLLLDLYVCVGLMEFVAVSPSPNSQNQVVIGQLGLLTVERSVNW